YAAEFAQGLPGAVVTLFDLEIVIPIARELSGNGFATLAGDFMEDGLGGPYDFVFMGGIVSGIALESVQALLKRVREVVVPGGSVVIKDIYVDPETNLYPVAAIDFHLTLLLENEHGRFRTVPELAKLMTAAGFSRHRHIPVEGHDFSFLVGQ